MVFRNEGDGVLLLSRREWTQGPTPSEVAFGCLFKSRRGRVCLDVLVSVVFILFWCLVFFVCRRMGSLCPPSGPLFLGLGILIAGYFTVLLLVPKRFVYSSPPRRRAQQLHSPKVVGNNVL